MNGHARDGCVDRLLYRRLSAPVTRALVPTPVTPNAVTMAGIVLGVAGGALLGFPGPLPVAAAVALLLASGVLDAVDGELARQRRAESRLGHWLDITGDTLVHLALLGGIAARMHASGAAIDGRVVAWLGAGVLGSFAVITWSEATESRRHRVPAWENRVLDGVLQPLSTRDWHVVVVAFAALGRLHALIPAAAVGAHLFWLAALVLLVRVLRRASFDAGPPGV
jgi:phosphatidylglycerophosphate synthase